MCTGLTEVSLPYSVTSIGSQAFNRCTSMASIEIPDGVTGIGSYAFKDCSTLASVSIPYSVTSIGYQAFANCGALTELTCKATTPPTCDSKVFSGVTTSECTLYVPLNATDYETTDPWSGFKIEYVYFGNRVVITGAGRDEWNYYATYVTLEAVDLSQCTDFTAYSIKVGERVEFTTETGIVPAGAPLVVMASAPGAYPVIKAESEDEAEDLTTDLKTPLEGETVTGDGRRTDPLRSCQQEQRTRLVRDSRRRGSARRQVLHRAT